jgi:hypothetical protein
MKCVKTIFSDLVELNLGCLLRAFDPVHRLVAVVSVRWLDRMTVGLLLTMCHQVAGHSCHRALIAIGMPWPIVTIVA